jgi:hypothetical protein
MNTEITQTKRNTASVKDIVRVHVTARFKTSGLTGVCIRIGHSYWWRKI